MPLTLQQRADAFHEQAKAQKALETSTDVDVRLELARSKLKATADEGKYQLTVMKSRGNKALCKEMHQRAQQNARDPEGDPLLKFYFNPRVDRHVIGDSVIPGSPCACSLWFEWSKP
jgi:hypothetical protein